MEESFTSQVTVHAAPSRFCGRIDVTWSSTIVGVNGISVDRTEMVSGRISHPVLPIGAAVSPWTDRGMACGVRYIYTVNVYSNGVWQSNGQSPETPSTSCCPRHSSAAFIQDENGDLNLLVPFNSIIGNFWHPTSVIDQQLWKSRDQLLPLPDMPQIRSFAVSLIQGASGKFEAIAREGQVVPITPQTGHLGVLAAYESTSGVDWQGPVQVVANDGPIDHTTGTPALIQTDYDNQGKFELLAPRGDVIDYYVRPGDSVLQGQWTHVSRLYLHEPAIQFSAVSFMQSAAGMLEAIALATWQPAPLAQASTTGYLLAFELDPISAFSPDSQVNERSEGFQANLYPQVAWQGPIPLVANDGPIDGITGTPALIQSDNDGKVQFELLAPRGTALNHYTLASGSILESPWSHIYSLMPPDDDPQAEFKAAWLLQDAAGRLEAVARLKPLQVTENEYLVGYEFEPTTGWKGPVRLISDEGPILSGINLF